MANYYTHASLAGAAALTASEIAWIENEINIEATLDELSDEERQEWAEERGFDDPEAGFGFKLSVEKLGEDEKFMWLTHDEDFNVVNACEFLQYWVRTKRPADKIRFEYAHSCSKPRLDAYGGGAAYITKGEIRCLSTHEWLSTQEG